MDTTLSRNNEGNWYLGMPPLKTEKKSSIEVRWINPEDSINQGIVIIFDNLKELMDGCFCPAFIPDNYYATRSYRQSFESYLGENFEFGLLISSSDLKSSKYNKKDGEIEYNEFEIGEHAYKRFVYPLDLPHEFPMRIGLTVHQEAGTWSSYPPHKFESNSIFSPVNFDFEEKFAYITDPPNGWGLQVMGKQVVPIKDRQIIDIPLSSHPVVAAPETRLAYVWCYTPPYEKFDEHGRV